MKIVIGKYSEKVDGLISYLFGAGHKNEHTNQHIIGSADGIEIDNESLSIDDQKKLCRDYLNEYNPPKEKRSKNNILELNLNIHSEDGLLTDGEWDDIAHEFALQMGFENLDDPSKDIHWVAIRHGLSANGNDGIHLAVNRYRADGTMWSDSNSKRRALKAERIIEKKFPFLSKQPRSAYDRTTKAWSQGEHKATAEGLARQRYEGDPKSSGKKFDDLDLKERNKLIWNIKSYELPRRKLQGLVRAAAVSSQSEDEFIRRLRGSGVLIKPRFDKNNPNEVVGYSVSLRGKDPEIAEGANAIYYGGGKLANDLTINRLRMHWAGLPDPSENEEDLQKLPTPNQARDEWEAAGKHKPTVHRGGEGYDPNENDYDYTGEQLKKFKQKLREAHSSGNAFNMSRANRYIAAALNATAQRFELEGSPFAQMANIVAVAAQTKNEARLHRPVNLEYEALFAATRILASSSNDYVRTLQILQTVFEITEICIENYLLEEEIRKAKEGVKLLKEELSSPLKLEGEMHLDDLRTRVQTAEDLERAERESYRFTVDLTGIATDNASVDDAYGLDELDEEFEAWDEYSESEDILDRDMRQSGGPQI